MDNVTREAGSPWSVTCVSQSNRLSCQTQISRIAAETIWLADAS